MVGAYTFNPCPQEADRWVSYEFEANRATGLQGYRATGLVPGQSEIHKETLPPNKQINKQKQTTTTTKRIWEVKAGRSRLQCKPHCEFEASLGLKDPMLKTKTKQTGAEDAVQV